MASFSNGFVPTPTFKPTQGGSTFDSIADKILGGLAQWWEYDSLETRLEMEKEYQVRNRLGQVANNPAGTVPSGIVSSITANKELLVMGGLAVGGLILLKRLK